jgi:hypothetical protein
MRTVAALLGLAIVALCSEPSWAACAKVNARALIGDDHFDCCKVVSHPVGRNSPGLRWVGASWYGGPPEGKLYVLDCGGTKVAEADLGSLDYVESLRATRSIGGIPTIAATHISTWGTGIEDHSVALVQYRGGRARVLWTHFIRGSWYPGDGRHNEEEYASWRVLRDGTRIEVITVHTIFGKHRKVRRLPTEYYCLRTAVWRFVPCK